MDTPTTTDEDYTNGYRKGTEIAERIVSSKRLRDLPGEHLFWSQFSPPDRFGQGTRRAILDLLEACLETL